MSGIEVRAYQSSSVGVPRVMRGSYRCLECGIWHMLVYAPSLYRCLKCGYTERAEHGGVRITWGQSEEIAGALSYVLDTVDRIGQRSHA